MANDIFSGRTLGGRAFGVEELGQLAIAVAMDKKASKPVLIDLRPQGAFTEYFAILSATNPRQVTAIAEEVRMFFKNVFGVHPVAADGFETCTWILLDYGSFFVHVFQESTRELYRLEHLWSKGRFIEIKEEATTKLLSEARALAKSAEEATDAQK
jgi:ribosome-associated protein